ncbi:MAG: hypothetical protein K2K94_05250, partial [Muribaculaceae bacterium]|nr:hypothetical protein [Muribaculaceae bacterium]
MKHIAFKSLMLGATLATTLTACDENSWNDEYLDGFDTPTITKKETVAYTMTAADIKKLANMPANIKLAAERGESAELAAVAANGFFTSKVTPEAYAPAWLDSLSAVKGSIVYWLSEKSTLQLSFPTSDALPAELSGIQNGLQYTVTEADYQSVWNSETDFVEAFAPSKPASKYLGDILDENLDYNVGDFVVVTYKQAGQDPVFGGSSTPEPTPGFEMSSTIGSLKVNASIEASGVVTALCKQGYILTDLSGSTLVYYGNNFDIDSYAVGQQRTVSGKGGCYGGCLQIAPTGDELVGTQEYTYPTPIEMTGEVFEQFSVERQALKADNNGGAPVYGEIKGATFTQSGNYINFEVPGADKSVAEGSGYQIPQNVADMLNFGNPVDVRGYVIGCSGKAYVTFLVTEVNGQKPASAPALLLPSRAGLAITSTEEKAVYKGTDDGWMPCNDVFALTANDYAQMGVASNLTSAQAETFLPIYLANKFPYAQEGATYYIVYNFKNGDNTIKNFTSRANYTGTEWTITTVNTDMMQFVRAGKGDGWSNWVYDPSVYIDLPAGRGASSADFWQACVDWAYEHVDVPVFGAESIISGIGYVTSYG